MPVAKTLSEYDFSQLPELNGAQFRQLCETTDWVDAGENVLLFGASGLGKSHLAAAIVDGVVGQGYRARFYSAGELLQELRKARAQLKRKRTARAVLTGMCYSAGSAMRHGSSSLTRLTGQSAMTPSTWRR